MRDDEKYQQEQVNRGLKALRGMLSAARAADERLDLTFRELKAEFPGGCWATTHVEVAWAEHRFLHLGWRPDLAERERLHALVADPATREQTRVLAATVEASSACLPDLRGDDAEAAVRDALNAFRLRLEAEGRPSSMPVARARRRLRSAYDLPAQGAGYGAPDGWPGWLRLHVQRIEGSETASLQPDLSDDDPTDPQPWRALPPLHVCAEHQIPVVYGFPTHEAAERARRGELVIGGCFPMGRRQVCSICRQYPSLMSLF